MKLNLYYVCDKKGYIIEKIKAVTLKNEVQIDGTQKWCLKYINGNRYDNMVFTGDEQFCCHEYTWVDPDAKFSDKIRKGREEEFEFFLKNGYHMPMNTERDAR